MPNNNGVWPLIRLGEVAEFRTGKLDSNQAVENGIYPFFTCSPETLLIDSFSFDTEAVLLAGNNANAIYPVKYYKGKFDAYQRTYIITPKNPDRLNCKYLYYQTQILADLLTEYSLGTATKFLTMRILNALEIPLPPINEQLAIARILGALDDKIELNRQMNRTLEAMAQAIFKSWFVDFDPVVAKAEGRQPYGMKAETAALFPAGFHASSIGDVPRGWRTLELGELCTVAIGGDWGKEAPFDDSILVSCLRGVDLEHLRENGYCTAPNRWVVLLSGK